MYTLNLHTILKEKLLTQGKICCFCEWGYGELHYWTLSFPIEINGFQIIKIRFMNLQDGLQTGAAKTQPLQVEIYLFRLTRLGGTPS